MNLEQTRAATVASVGHSTGDCKYWIRRADTAPRSQTRLHFWYMAGDQAEVRRTSSTAHDSSGSLPDSILAQTVGPRRYGVDRQQSFVKINVETRLFGRATVGQRSPALLPAIRDASAATPTLTVATPVAFATPAVAAVTLIKLNNQADILPRRSAPLKISPMNVSAPLKKPESHVLLRKADDKPVRRPLGKLQPAPAAHPTTKSAASPRNKASQPPKTRTNETLLANDAPATSSQSAPPASWLVEESLALCTSPTLSDPPKTTGVAHSGSARLSLSLSVNNYPPDGDNCLPEPSLIPHSAELPPSTPDEQPLPLSFPDLRGNNNDALQMYLDDVMRNYSNCTSTDQVQRVATLPPADVRSFIQLNYSTAMSSQNAPIDFESLTISEQLSGYTTELPENTEPIVDDAVLDQLQRIHGQMLIQDRHASHKMSSMRRSVTKTVTFAVKNTAFKPTKFEQMGDIPESEELADEGNKTDEVVQDIEAPPLAEEKLKNEDPEMSKMRRKAQLALFNGKMESRVQQTQSSRPKAKRVAGKSKKGRRVRKKSRPARKQSESESNFSSIASDDDWFSKYCIIQAPIGEMCAAKFKEIDPWREGFITLPVAIGAIQAVNHHIKSEEQQYLESLLEILSYEGYINELLFTVVTALSLRIASLDSQTLGVLRDSFKQCSMKALEYVWLKAESLWKMCINAAMEPTHVDLICIELQAGGITQSKLEVFRRRICSNNRGLFDFIDFLIYLPLFLMTHEAVIKNPLASVS